MALAVTLTRPRLAVGVVVLAFVLLGCLVLYVEGAHWGLTFLVVVAILVCFQWPTDGRGGRADPMLPVQAQGAASASVARALPREPPVYVYRKRKAGDVCAVCLGEVQRGEVVKRLPACAHLFHEGCIDKWLSSRKTCPVCRSRVDVAAAAADPPAVEATLPSRAGPGRTASVATVQDLVVTRQYIYNALPPF